MNKQRVQSPNMSLKKQLVNKGVSSVLVRILGTGAAFALSVFLARSLDANGFGLYSFVLALLVFFTVPLQAGLPNLIVRESAKLIISGDWSSIKGLALWVLKLLLLYSISLCILFGAVSQFDLTILRGERLLLFATGLALIPLLPLLLIQGALIRGLGHVIAGIIPDAILRPILTLFFATVIIYVARDNLTPLAALVAYITAICVSVFASTTILWWLIPKEEKNLEFSTAHQKDWKKAAYPLTVAGGLQLMFSYTDIIILGAFHSNEDVGVYRAASQLSILVAFGLSAINQMLHSHFARLYAQKQMRKLQQLVTYSSIAISGIAAAPALVFLFGGELVLETVFGKEFIDGALPLAILTIGQLANAIFGSVGAILNMTGHERDSMRGMCYSLFANIILSIMLIPEYGLTGAAFSTAVSLLVWNFILRIYVKKRLDIETVGFISILKIGVPK